MEMMIFIEDSEEKTTDRKNSSEFIKKFYFHLSLFEMANARTQMTAEQIIHSRKPDVDFSQASTGAVCNARASTWSINVHDR